MKRTPLFSLEVNVDDYDIYDSLEKSLDKPAWRLVKTFWPWSDTKEEWVEITWRKLLEIYEE